jgi:hypothetical protein
MALVNAARLFAPVDADTLAHLRKEHLLDVGEVICVIWNG